MDHTLIHAREFVIFKIKIRQINTIADCLAKLGSALSKKRLKKIEAKVHTDATGGSVRARN
jgi:hypothetical protein